LNKSIVESQSAVQKRVPPKIVYGVETTTEVEQVHLTAALNAGLVKSTSKALAHHGEAAI
jgi:hypothetical protein